MKSDLNTNTFTIHRLVQAVTRQRLSETAARTHLIEALGWVNKAFVGDPQDVRGWPTLDPILPHALAVTATDYIEPIGNPEPTSRLLNQMAQLLDAKAQLPEAEPLMRRALAIGEASLGLNHPKVAIRLNNLAQLLQATNRLDQAEPLYRRAFPIFFNSLGREHPNTRTVFDNYAGLLMEMGQTEEQAIASIQALIRANAPQ